MPKAAEFPRASLSKAIELATAVYELGGTASAHTTADKLGKRVGGAFSAVMSATSNYGFIDKKSGNISTTELFRLYKLSYNEAESNQVLIKAILNVPIFERVYERLKGNRIPIPIFDRMLVRDFDVPDSMASKVAKYFIDAGKQTGLINSDDFLVDINLNESCAEEQQIEDDEYEDNQDNEIDAKERDNIISNDKFVVKISGPGMNSTVAISDTHDLDIVKIMLSKIEKKMEDKIDD